jgi:hypothetical protein
MLPCCSLVAVSGTQCDGRVVEGSDGGAGGGHRRASGGLCCGSPPLGLHRQMASPPQPCTPFAATLTLIRWLLEYMLWLTSSYLPYCTVKCSVVMSYRCSQEFFSFRTLCKKKEFQVNERQSSTEKMGFLYLFHPGFKIDDVEFWRFLNILQICFWMRDRQKVIAEISQLFCMFYVVAAVFHAILKISLGC